MIRSILIANRGEIAVRIIRTCREMGLRSVAVFSEADADALHVRMADQAVCIGPAASAKSYLNQNALLTAALSTGCDAIHPGVGFLSENASFAGAVQKAGLIFIGADPDLIKLLGDKIQAKETARSAGLPLVPGSDGPIENVDEAIKVAEKIGTPLIVKAASGGGGRGMRIIRNPVELEENIRIASSEAMSFFSDGTIFLERYLENPRHVEIQILSDGHGEVIYLGERDCSVQKNYQKLLEESPSTAVSPKLRETMRKDVIRLFRKLKYAGAATVEFLVENDHHYFMEVNARVQVEHPVTELISGVDIIREQILACSEGRMDITQDSVTIKGYALETRVNAVTPGKVTIFEAPGGPFVRTDTFLYPGCVVSPHYDSMIAKILVWAPDRKLGLARMSRALRETRIEGITTNIDEQLTILESPQFRSGRFGTSLYGLLKTE
ncbi:MAG: biotin carboxylase N-terminal domain-containing protein [Spirochaetaceae bacterium]|nr:biotin carboxylase N-terminal domain-containing protein [Spirochaetaceae bacterium]MDT8297441.1 biotin carboxylase N-terminal domain-containing protein [Spirochaetaceae bacterium]